MTISEPAVPTLLYLLCAMSAMAFLLSAYLWLWRAAYGENNLDFKPSIYKGQLYSLLSVMVISIILGSYDHFIYKRELHISGEVLVLLSALAYVYVKADRRRIYSMLGLIKGSASFGFFCVAGWGGTFAFGFLLSYVSAALGLSSAITLNPNIVFIIGLLWIVPVAVLYIKITNNPDRKPALNGDGFHRFLWPVLMAYIVLLFPLLMQQISVSEKWQQIKHEKPFKMI